jgi:hypothetical protein
MFVVKCVQLCERRPLNGNSTTGTDSMNPTKTHNRWFKLVQLIDKLKNFLGSVDNRVK